MLIQVVHCHPLVESYNHALFRTIVETLKQNGHKVVATDLYREGFQPAMTEPERRTYMDMSYDKSAFADYARTLKEVEGVILCFPHWWFSMPAVLKGWVDRVWGPGVAFTYDAKDNHLVPALGNIRLFAGDAAELLAWAPPRSLARIDLIHPDPWPKRRHWKRRFVQDATVNAMARVLKPDGEFRFVSDIDDYCAWTLAHLSRSADFVWTAEQASDWRLPWPDYTMTRYGRKAEREGRKAAYLRFRKVG